MRVIFLNGFSGANNSYKAKDEDDLDDFMAIQLIDAGIAKPKNKKEYEALKAKIEQLKTEKEEQKAKAVALLKQKELKSSAEVLAKELESTLELILDEEFKKELDLSAKFKIESEEE